MARRKAPPVLRRRPAREEPKLVLHVFCEGANTEPSYLLSFAQAWGNRVVKVVPIEAAGVPMTLVQRARSKKSELEKTARREGDSFSSRFEVWGVFDIDEHPNVAEATALAKQSGVKVCKSNPCFELWALLHFKRHDAEIHRWNVQRMLKTYMPNYDPNSSKTLQYDLLHERFRVARDNAIWLAARRTEERNGGGNPSTNVHDLLTVIVDMGKRASS